MFIHGRCSLALHLVHYMRYKKYSKTIVKKMVALWVP